VLAASIAVMMEKVSTSETSVNFCQNRIYNIPEGSHLQINSKRINFGKECVLFFILFDKPQLLKR
jgi:hypothetical protein